MLRFNSQKILSNYTNKYTNNINMHPVTNYYPFYAVLLTTNTPVLLVLHYTDGVLQLYLYCRKLEAGDILQYWHLTPGLVLDVGAHKKIFLRNKFLLRVPTGTSMTNSHNNISSVDYINA